MNLLHFKNTPIAYSDIGKGTAVVLLHGFLENRSMWDTYIPELTKKYRVITIDLLGHGGSGCLGYIHTMEDNADVVYEVLSTLKIKKAILTGHSMGGYVALAFAELYPEKIKGLVLINSTSKPDNEERRQNRDRAIKAVKQSYTNFVSLSIANLFSEDNRDKLKEEIEKVKVQALQTPLQGIIASLEGMKVRKGREVLLHNSTYPKMLVLGKKDPVLNYEENVEQVKGTSVTLITLPDGHMSPIENRDELLKVILDFLKKI
jgi:pimeloyl-ACP methyl ester carboxylesterase